jgi:PilZ domain
LKMQFRSDLATTESSADSPARRYYRHRIQNLAYVNLDQGNGGIIRDLNEHGLAIQAVAPLRSNQQVYLRFELLAPRVRIEASGRVAWADSSGQAGVEFATLPKRSRTLLKEWVFTQLLTTAHHVAWDSIFSERKERADPGELAFSASARVPIELEHDLSALEHPAEPAAVHMFGCPVALSRRGLAHLVDGLILMSATLLFIVVSLAVSRIFPGWNIALPLILAVAVVFAGIYWYVFNSWIGCTPGTQMACTMGKNRGEDSEDADRARFR